MTSPFLGLRACARKFSRPGKQCAGARIPGTLARVPPGQPATDDTAAWAALLRVHAALVPRLDRVLRAAVGLPLAWYDVLLELHAAPERQLRMTDLGERVVLSRSRASRVVDELAAAGLVRRDVNPEDGRSALATLTDRGAQRLREAAPIYLDGIERHFTRHLSARERDIVAHALNRVIAVDPIAPPDLSKPR